MVAVAVAAILFVGGAVFAVVDYESEAGPAHVVASYFHAVADGDAEAALGYGDVPAGDRSYLTADVLRAQLANGSIHAIQTSRAAGGRVDVSYQLGGRTIDDVVGVVKRDGRWRLAASAVRTSVSLADAEQRAEFAGAAVPTDQPLLFPGALPIRFDTPSLELAPGAVVAFSGSTTTSLPVAVSAAGQNAVEAATKAALTACVASATPAALCPVPVATGIRAVPASLHGTIVGTPTIRATVAPEATGKLSISGSMTVDGTYQTLDYQNQPSVKTGSVTVTFTAWDYATDPTKIVWSTT